MIMDNRTSGGARLLTLVFKFKFVYSSFLFVISRYSGILVNTLHLNHIFISSTKRNPLEQDSYQYSIRKLSILD